MKKLLKQSMSMMALIGSTCSFYIEPSYGMEEELNEQLDYEMKRALTKAYPKDENSLSGIERRLRTQKSQPLTELYVKLLVAKERQKLSHSSISLDLVITLGRLAEQGHISSLYNFGWALDQECTSEESKLARDCIRSRNYFHQASLYEILLKFTRKRILLNFLS